MTKRPWRSFCRQLQIEVDTKGYQYSDKLIVEKNADPKLVVGRRTLRTAALLRVASVVDVNISFVLCNQKVWQR